MHIFKTIDDMRGWISAQKAQGKKIAFVPTMGALHEGHLSLLREGRKRGDALVLSIYVNPTQFGPTEDLERYPRDLAGDLAKARACGVDAVFLPSDAVMYPAGASTFVTVEGLSRKLCGHSRPTHFRGVTTVVAKLFHIVEPDAAIFGEKDFQQLAIIRRMTRDLDLPVEIVGAPIVREEDGVAMSSRNAYLSDEERTAARSLAQALERAGELIAEGASDPQAIVATARETIEATGRARIDYVELVDPETLEPLSRMRAPALLALAAFFGTTRLIDNRLYS